MASSGELRNPNDMLRKEKSNDAGAKFDAGKPSVGLMDRTALLELTRVLDFGAKKYASHNWKGGIKWQRIIDSAMRHLIAFNDGEDLDPETGISHMAHCMCNCMFLLNYIKFHPELDDRYRPAPTSLLRPGMVVPCKNPQNVTHEEMLAAQKEYDQEISRLQDDGGSTLESGETHVTASPKLDSLDWRSHSTRALHCLETDQPFPQQA